MSIDFDVPPPPPETAPEAADRFDKPVACRLSFLGLGQAGGRLAETFHALGYCRVAALNTAQGDLAGLSLAAQQKLDIGGGGANKEPARAAAQLATKTEELHALLQTCWGTGTEIGLLCLGAGGGTGAGTLAAAADVARAHLCGGPVGAIVALPKDAEGVRPARNAVETLRLLRKLNLAPLILIDNQRIYDQWRGRIPVGAEHATYNRGVCQLLHAFNQCAAEPGDHTTFDVADFRSLLLSGQITFGVGSVPDWSTATHVTAVIRDQLAQSALVAADLRTSDRAALIYTLGGSAYQEVPVSHLDAGVAMLTRQLAEKSTVFQGIFKGQGDVATFKVAVLVGRLGWPLTRIKALARIANLSDVDDLLGV